MQSQWEESKHARDRGQFAPKGGPHRGAAPQAPMAGREKPPQPQRQTQQPQQARSPRQSRTFGFHASTGYRLTGDAIRRAEAGDHAHLREAGIAVQRAIQELRRSGASDQELFGLRRHLSGLGKALRAGDKVAAHESLMALHHEFFRAYATAEKAHGPGFPKLGSSKDVGLKPDEVFGLGTAGTRHVGSLASPGEVGDAQVERATIRGGSAPPDAPGAEGEEDHKKFAARDHRRLGGVA